MGYAKLLIKGNIEVQTGLHIGGTDGYSAIGAVDSPVIKDSVSGIPMIPGSSIKGKMRHLLQKIYGMSPSPDEDDQRVCRLFGTSASAKEILPSRLKFSDCFINEDKLNELRDANIRLTEVKSENTIDRKTAKANPRQIERVIRGTVFDLEIIYDIQNGSENETEEDFKNISTALKLLENDYLGGHGSRGSGRVKFKNLEVVKVYGELDKLPTLEV